MKYRNVVDLLMLRNRVFRLCKVHKWVAVLKRLRFADTQELCFEAWKRSHMGCAALICGRFDDALESRLRMRIIKMWAVPL